uniref:Uncharacterized protein n=1 Tax=Romanomermis culicivorax TaxID=13658 RepID=A0A915J1U6_ROMCU
MPKTTANVQMTRLHTTKVKKAKLSSSSTADRRMDKLIWRKRRESPYDDKNIDKTSKTSSSNYPTRQKSHGSTNSDSYKITQNLIA